MLTGPRRRSLRMSAKKKRRQLPEEDLAAAVAEIINSPITRSNLSFLRPMGGSAPTESEQPHPKPMGFEVTPMGYRTTPMGDELGGKTAEPLPLVSEELPVHDILEGKG